PVVCLEKNSSTRRYVDDFLMARGAAIHPEIELATSDMIVQFALRNLGVACVVRDFAQPYLEAGTLFELRFESSLPAREMELVTNEKLPPTSASAKFLEMLKL
ncbi:MAG: LysR substrate-binding domain-containing protein, partial [Lachnospiraceae bacterium]